MEHVKYIITDASPVKPLTVQEIERLSQPAYERSIEEMREYWRERFRKEREKLATPSDGE